MTTEQPTPAELAAAEQRIEWGVRTTFPDGEQEDSWRGTRQAADERIEARRERGWTAQSDLIYRRHLTLPTQVYGQPTEAKRSTDKDTEP